VQRFESIEVDISKLRDYCLSETHPRGRHKARVFQSRLGLTADNAEFLRQVLLAAVGENEADFEAAVADEYGQRFNLDFPLKTDRGTAMLRSAWIVRTGEKVLRFASCYLM